MRRFAKFYWRLLAAAFTGFQGVFERAAFGLLVLLAILSKFAQAGHEWAQRATGWTVIPPRALFWLCVAAFVVRLMYVNFGKFREQVEMGQLKDLYVAICKARSEAVDLYAERLSDQAAFEAWKARNADWYVRTRKLLATKHDIGTYNLFLKIGPIQYGHYDHAFDLQHEIELTKLDIRIHRLERLANRLRKKIPVTVLVSLDDEAFDELPAGVATKRLEAPSVPPRISADEETPV